MSIRLRSLLSILVGIGFCTLQCPARTAPLYDFQPLPTPAGAGQALAVVDYREGGVNDLSHKRVAVAGTVDVAGVDHAALWRQRRGGGWRLGRLAELGYGSSANDVEIIGSGAQRRVAAAGHIVDAFGVTHGALWIDFNNDGAIELVPLGTPGGPGSKVHGIVPQAFSGEDLWVVYVVGERQGPSGDWNAAVWRVDGDAAAPGVSVSDLPGPPGRSSEAVAGFVLPNGRIRIQGCIEDDAGLERGAEWDGSPEAGFTAMFLPEPSPGLTTHHFNAGDHRGRFAVGAQFYGDGSYQPAAWATFPPSFGPWNPLPIPTDYPTSGAYTGVNSLGRAVGVWQWGLSQVAFNCQINVPGPEIRPFSLIDLLFRSRGGIEIPEANAISQDGTIAGGARMMGDPSGLIRPCVFTPSGTEVVDYLSVAQGEVVGDATNLEQATFRDDDRALAARPQDDGVVCLFKSYVNDASPAAVLSVVSHVEGLAHGRAMLTVELWDVQMGAYVTIGTDVVGAKDHASRFRIDDVSVKYRDSETGRVQLRLSWSGFSAMAMPPAVSVNSVTMGATNSPINIPVTLQAPVYGLPPSQRAFRLRIV